MDNSLVGQLLRHVENTRYDTLPADVIRQTKAFILDSIGVGISGSSVSKVAQVKDAVNHWGQAQQAQVWVTGEWLPAASAAMINGYQIHNQEWDCVHEPAVVHPMAVILSALMAYAQQHKLSGKQLILGVALAVDVATLIGQSATSGLKFFRPSVCGCLGATAGLSAMRGLGRETLVNAMGIAYSQLSGTMQAHVEGSPMLALQIGLGARSAIQAVDLANSGFEGPKDILEGPYGYFSLFEDEYDPTPITQKLGNEFQIMQVSHKPFPTGRAGHGTIDGLLTLQRQFGFRPQDIAVIDVYAPPLINRLVGRQVKDNMSASYAKLCNGYIAASALLSGYVAVKDFSDDALNSPERLELALKVNTHLNDCSDPNALSPVAVVVTCTNGDQHHIQLAHVLGSPEKPLSRDAQIAKFKAACRSAKGSFSDTNIDNLIKRIDELDQIPNIGELVNFMVGEQTNDPSG